LLKQFNEIIQRGEEILRFSFYRVYTTNGEKYFVEAYKGKRFFPFDMKKDVSGNEKRCIGKMEST